MAIIMLTIFVMTPLVARFVVIVLHAVLKACECVKEPLRIGTSGSRAPAKTIAPDGIGQRKTVEMQLKQSQILLHAW